MKEHAAKLPVQQPWFKQLWPWLLIAGPLLVVVASAITIALAIHTEDTVVSDDYYKQGKEIHLLSHRDELAIEEGWQGRVLLSEQHAAVRVFLSSTQQRSFPEMLRLSFFHPTRGVQDLAVELKHQGNGLYDGALPLSQSKHWYVEISPAQADSWRLKGEWYPEDDGNIITLTHQH